MTRRGAGVILVGFALLAVGSLLGHWLFSTYPLQFAASISFLYGLGLFVATGLGAASGRGRSDGPESDEWPSDASRWGTALTLLLAMGGWPFVFVETLDALAFEEDAFAGGLAEAVIAVVGIGLPRGISSVGRGIVLTAVCLLYFDLAFRVASAYWRYLDRVWTKS